MWTLLNILARAPLADTLAAWARHGDQACLRVLAHREPTGAAADALAAASAGAACWHILAAALPPAERRLLRRDLRAQRRLLAPLLAPPALPPHPDWVTALAALARTPGEARAVAEAADGAPAPQRGLGRRAARRLRARLKARRRWVAAVAALPPEAEAVLHRALVRALVRAGRGLARHPRGGRGARKLARQQALLAVLGVAPRASRQDPLGVLAVATEALKPLLAEDAWLRALAAAPGGGRRRLAALARRRRRALRPQTESLARVCEIEPGCLAAGMAWQVFLAGAAEPVTDAAATAAAPPGGDAVSPAAARR